MRARWVVTAGLLAASLGRSLALNAPNVTVNMVQPGTLFGDSLNQVHLRFTNPVRDGATRLGLNFELDNALNANAVRTENTTSLNAGVSGWRIPTSIEPLRTLATFRRNAEGQVEFGQNLLHAGTGRIEVGMPVELLD
jgi:hypothetical protein